MLVRPLRVGLTTFFVSLASALPSACQSETATPGGAPMCAYGQRVPCGANGTCETTCLPDLSGYGPCICPDAGVDAGDAASEGSG